MTMTPAMQLALDANFGSVARWHADFIACGEGRRGGTAVLAFEPRQGTLANRWLADAATDAGVPLLTLNVPDHRRAASDIDWADVYERYGAAVNAASEGFGATQSEVAGTVLIDVRRAAIYAQADSMIPGARWRDPAAVSSWAAELPADRPCVVYCIYGHEVGRATALRLRAAGVDARYLQGGIDAWKSAGQALMAKPVQGPT